MSPSDPASPVAPIDGRVALPQDDVRNPLPPLAAGNLFTADRLLVDALRKAGGRWIEPRAKAVGAIMAGQGAIWAARRELPTLQKFDRAGHRIDEIAQSDAWCRVLNTARQYALHSLTAVDKRDGAHTARAVMIYTLGQVAPAIIAPISITHAGLVVLEQASQAVRKRWLPTLTAVNAGSKATNLDGNVPGLLGLAVAEKHAVMAMGSGKQGFATIAQPISGRGSGGGAAFELTGHKWWAVVPQADALVVLAKSPVGPSCFLVPKLRPDGRRNRIHVQALSEPFPNAPEAIASLEFHGAFATLLGEEGDGFAVIQPLHHHLVVDQVVVLAGMLRQLLTQLLHFVSHRQKGGKVLLSDLAVKQTLADLSLEVEAAMRLAMQLAVWLDSPPEHQYLPMFSALAAKYWLMRRVKISAVEVMDLVGFHARSDHDRSFDFVGGAAFVGMVDGGLGLSGINDSVTSQLSDDALTMLRRHPGLADAVVNHLVATGRNHPMLGVHIERLMPILQAASNVDTRYGRRSLELTALGLQAAAMVASAPELVSNLFCQTRLDAERSYNLGASPMPGNLDDVIERLQLQSV